MGAVKHQGDSWLSLLSVPMKTFIFTSPALIFDSHEVMERLNSTVQSFLLASLLNPCDFRSLFDFFFFAPNWVKVSPGAICSQYGPYIGNNRFFPFDMAALMCSYSQFGGKYRFKKTSQDLLLLSCAFTETRRLFSGQQQRGLAILFDGLSWISWAGARLKLRTDCRLRQSSSSGYLIRSRSGHRRSVKGMKNSRTRTRLKVKTHERETCWSKEQQQRRSEREGREDED